MKKVLVAVLVMLFCSNVGFAKDIYIVCTHREAVSSSITLSYNDENLKGKEYVGQGTSIPYDVEVTDADIIFNRYNEGKFIRGWNINRYSGNGLIAFHNGRFN